MRNGWMGLVLLLAVVGVAACRSDEDRLKHLEQVRGFAYLSVIQAEQILDSLEASGLGREDALYAAQLDSLFSLRRRLELADRDLRRFLR